MKKVIILACMGLMFSAGLHAATMKGSNPEKKAVKNTKEKQALKLNFDGCTRVPVECGWIYTCTSSLPCQPQFIVPCQSLPGGGSITTAIVCGN